MSQNLYKWIAVAVGLIVVVIFLFDDITQPAVNTLNEQFTASEQATAGSDITNNNEQTMLEIKDVEVGDGTEAVAGTKVTVHYTGTLTDGTVFDSSHSRNAPFEFDLGAGQVIAGWEQGVAGMKIGGKRMLTIPPELAYGDRAIGAIPAGSTLIFEIELLGVDAQ